MGGLGQRLGSLLVCEVGLSSTLYSSELALIFKSFAHVFDEEKLTSWNFVYRVQDTWPYVLLPGEQQHKAYVQCEMRKVFRCPDGSKLVMRNGSPLCKEQWLEA